MINTRSFSNEIEIHTTPLEEIQINEGKALVFFDDINEIRWCAEFDDVFGIKVIAIDFADFEWEAKDGNLRNIRMKEKSRWLTELAEMYRAERYPAEYFQGAIHYIFLFQDTVVEVVSKNIVVEKCGWTMDNIEERN